MSFILIGVAAYGRVSSIVTNITIFGAVIACGVFLLLLSLVGLIGAVKHHQVLLFFVSFLGNGNPALRSQINSIDQSIFLIIYGYRFYVLPRTI